jgi:hypothetical protein
MVKVKPEATTGKGGTGMWENAKRQIREKTTAQASKDAGQGSTGEDSTEGSGTTFNAPKSYMQDIRGGGSGKAKPSETTHSKDTRWWSGDE